MSPFSVLNFIGAKDDGGWQLEIQDTKAPVKSSSPTNQHPAFNRPDALPVAQLTVSEYWWENYPLDFLHITSCRREAATICPRTGLQVVTRYTSYTHMDRSLTQWVNVDVSEMTYTVLSGTLNSTIPYHTNVCWPASTANQSGPVTLTFWPWKWYQSHVTWATSVPILVFLGLSVLDLGPMYADRQTSDMHQCLMPTGRGIINTKTF